MDEGFIPNGPQDTVGYQGVRLMERPDYNETAAVLRVDGSNFMKACTSLGDATCTIGANIKFNAILQPCAASSDLNCISEFGVIAPDGTKIPALFSRKFPSAAANKYPADASSGLPAGEPGGLWTVPASAGLPTELHYVRAAVIGKVDSSGKAVFTDFAANLTPVTMTTMTCSQSTSWVDPAPYPCTSGYFHTDRDPPGSTGFIEGSGWDQNLDCEMSGNRDVAKGTAECALRKPALLTTKYYLSVRLAQSPQGWLHGRLSEAEVSITAIDGVKNAITMSVAGKPVRVPVVFKQVKFDTLPGNLQDAYRQSGGWKGADASNWGQMDTDSKSPTGRNRLSIPTSYGASAIDELKAWMPFLNDTSTADRATWSLRTLSSWERGQANSCIADTTRVTGMVLTNATQYLAGAPTYNKSAGTLDYKVAAPHYMSSGDVFKGSYQLIVRSDVARCIYGFTSAPVQASIDVVEENGAAGTAATSVAETDGWLKLSAVGFTFSSPTVRAKLTQPSAASSDTPSATAPVSANPTATPAATPASSTRPTMKTKATLAAKSVASAAGLTVGAGAKVTLSVSSSSRKICQVSAGRLKALKKGTCKVSVTVAQGKKKSTKSVSISVI